MRKLASIQVISKLEPIPNADRILKAVVNGWECVVAKSDNFTVGDKIIYIEVDSVLPPRPEFAFLKERNYRVKTIKLKKQISQGLILPLHYLKGNFAIGEDVTNLLGIVKYDPQAEQERKLLEKKNVPLIRKLMIKNPIVKYLMHYVWFRNIYNKFVVTNCAFPTNIMPKTDEERIQNMPNEFEAWRDLKMPFYGTEKVDGTSASYFLSEGQFGVCSRNLWLRCEDNSCYWEVAKRFDLKVILKDLVSYFGARKVVIQGEIIGQGIQGNKYKISGYEFYMYNLIVDGIKFNQDELIEVGKRYHLKVVPTLYKGYTLPDTIQELVEVSKGKSKLLNSQEREGIVYRNYPANISFKVISPAYLLKNGD